MKYRRWWVLILVAAALLSGCSPSTEGGFDGGEEPAPVPDVPDGDSRDDEGGEQGGGQGETPIDVRDVVLRAQLDLVVEDTDETVEAIRALVAREGGFVAAADLRRTDEGGQLAGWLTLRVPAARLDPTLDALEDLADEVRSRTLSSEDVTGQAIDLDARLVNLRALERELRELLTEVRDRPGASPEELLAVFDRISQTRGEIERLEAQRDALAELVELATVTVQVTPAESAAPLASPWSPAEVARRAARALIDAGQAVASGLIWVGIVGVPILVVVGALALGVQRARRRRQPPEPHPDPASLRSPEEATSTHHTSAT